MIKAPYNFVPLNEYVFFPDWANQVNQDVPFSDAESGCITIRLKAESPVYVRNGGAWPNDSLTRNRLPEYAAFSHFNNRYFIPSTSIKGMIRSVLEILSFSKMGKGQINDHRYSYRDLTPDSPIAEKYKEKLVGSQRVDNAWKSKVKTGWLHGYFGSLSLTPCECARIEQTELHTFHKGEIDLHSPQNSAEKYRRWGNTPLEVNFDLVTENGSLKTVHNHSQPLWYYKATRLGTGSRTGTLVFTGQPNRRKHMEFIFHSPAQEDIPIVKELERDFLFIHSKNGKPNDELNLWLDSRSQIQDRIPVFYLENDDGSIHSIGLAQMYKLAYDKSVYDLLPEDHKVEGQPDLAELIFGTVEGDALKGRVQFSHAFAVHGSAQPMEQCSRILGGPKASFAPTYLKNGGTYFDPHPQLNGRKRYPVHPGRSGVSGQQVSPGRTTTNFIPLQTGAEFVCKVRFHNLRKAEIGALLSALTFHGNKKEIFHSLGMAKPLGCGKISVAIKQITSSFLTLDNVQEYLSCFVQTVEKKMQRRVHNFSWKNQDQISELLTMASEQSNEVALSYLQFSTIPENNEFIQVRRANEYLQRYSSLPGVQKVELPASIKEQFDNAVQSQNREKIFSLLKGLSIIDIPEIKQCVFADHNVFNWSFIETFLACEVDDTCKNLICNLLPKKKISKKNKNGIIQEVLHKEVKERAAKWREYEARNG